jgi:hypothetical protein
MLKRTWGVPTDGDAHAEYIYLMGLSRIPTTVQIMYHYIMSTQTILSTNLGNLVVFLLFQ